MDSRDRLKRFVVVRINRENLAREVDEVDAINKVDVIARYEILYPNWLVTAIKEVNEGDEEGN